MGTRGRRSSAALAVVADGIETRPAPPESLTPLETEIWQGIVGDLPADWFSPGDQPLLKAYVQACAYLEILTPMVQAALEAGTLGHPAFALRKATVIEMAMLATKLRLAQSTRYNAKRANTKFDKGTKAKLWAV